MLYDFSLQEGDTLNACVLEIISEPFLSYVPRIDSIRQETFLGQETRAFYTQGVFINEGLLPTMPGRLLEGFGYELHGLFNFGRKGPLVRFVSYCEGDSIDCGFLTAVKESPEMPQPVIMLSPNPTHNVVIIQMDPAFRKETELQVSLINAAGKVVRRVNWNTLKALEVDVSTLPEGMYFLNVSGEKMSVVKKLVIAD
ncbi:MAG: T9SS type A sorting domain-containing protein [Saprospiraceae bacterium]|nr:T9SS type A sorting domain-containing protein [Saprospiraceae bacterium]